MYVAEGYRKVSRSDFYKDFYKSAKKIRFGLSWKYNTAHVTMIYKDKIFDLQHLIANIFNIIFWSSLVKISEGVYVYLNIF